MILAIITNVGVGLILFLITLVIWSLWNQRIFKAMGVPSPRAWPLIGNITMYRKGVDVVDSELRRHYGRTYGIHEGGFPVLVTSDVEFIKEFCVKKFEKFTNRRVLKAGTDDYGRAMVSNLEDSEWHRLRSTISPALSVTKLREMAAYVDRCGVHLQKLLAKSEECDIKDSFGIFSLDVIANCGFSTEIDLADPDEDQFLKYSKKAFDFQFFNPFIMLVFMFPEAMDTIFSWVKISLISEDVKNFYYSLIDKIIDQRKEFKDDYKRSDFLQVMLNSMEKIQPGHAALNKIGMTKTEVVGQSFLFFLAGYETTSSALTWSAYNLALRPECQDKLIAEVDEYFPDNATATYDGTFSMKYLDIFLKETLRLYAPVVRFDRKCKEDCEITGIHIPKNTIVACSVYNLHREEEYWGADVLEFRPERFHEPYPPFAYAPFGLGPRNCLAMRFALMEVKIGLIKLLQQFRLETCDKTEIPCPVKKAGFYSPEKGLWLKLKKRHVD